VCSAVTATGASREARTRGSWKRFRNFMMTFGGERDQMEWRKREEGVEGLEMLGLWGMAKIRAVAGPCEAWSFCC
jgi:hypothetical protein